MHHRRIGARDAIGEGHEARAAALGRLDQSHDFRQQRAFAGSSDADAQGGAEIDHAGEDPRARATACGTLSPVTSAASSVEGALAHQPVGAQPLAGGDQQHVARHQRIDAPRGGAALGQDDRRGAGGERHQRAHRMPCPAAGPAIEIAADQQEEEERDRRIEVGMLLARHASCRLTRQASVTPIEIGTSMLVRPARRAAKAERKKGWPA